jgi:hypothetical protein
MTSLLIHLTVHGTTKLLSRIVGVLVVFCFFSLTACSPDAFFTNLPFSGDNKVLFKDDFSKPSGGWTTQRDENTVIDYENGGFRIWVNQPNFDYWSVPGLRFTDVSIDVDARKLAGPDDNDYGIICRYIDQDNFYGFLISSDGYFGISKRKNGDHAIMGGQEMRPNTFIHTGTTLNHIHADCIGSTLTLYVNNEKMAQVTDPDFTVGDVGLLAGSFAQNGVDILFKNFSVRKP